jgi:hypothetical protein
MSPMVMRADRVTVEYDTVRGVDAVAIMPFSECADEDAGVIIAGTLTQLRGVVDTMARLLDDLDEGDERTERARVTP